VQQQRLTGDRADRLSNLPRAAAASIAYYRHQGSAALPGIVFFGGFRSDMTGVKAQYFAHFCASRNQSYVCFDYQGHGRSSTSFEDCTIGLWLEDALAILDHATAGPQILVGSSMGAWIALLAALRNPARIAALVGIAAAVDFTERLLWPKLGDGGRQALIEAGRVRIPSAYNPEGYVVTHRLVEEARHHLLLDRPIALDAPVRLFHGLADPDIPWRHSLDLAAVLASRDVVVTLVKDGDHRLSQPDHLVRFGQAIAELSHPSPTPPADRPDKSDGPA
jgi:pimeloyl-ACP methyl ester carboxylesterase